MFFLKVQWALKKTVSIRTSGNLDIRENVFEVKVGDSGSWIMRTAFGANQVDNTRTGLICGCP